MSDSDQLCSDHLASTTKETELHQTGETPASPGTNVVETSSPSDMLCRSETLDDELLIPGVKGPLAVKEPLEADVAPRSV